MSMSTIRKSSVVWLTLGVILIAAVAAIRIVVPVMTKLPTHFDESQRFEGTITALNPHAFATNDLPHLISPEAPITAQRSLAVDATDGDTAIVTSKVAIAMPGGTTANDEHSYAVSRVDFSPVSLSSDRRDHLVPDNVRASFEPHQGIAFSWPMNPPKDGTALYDSVTQSAQPAQFTAEGNLEGREVYNYRIDATGPVKSPAVLAQFKDFPSRLPKAVVAGLLQAGIVPAGSVATLQANLAAMPDLLDISYVSSNLIDISVDKEFGAPLRVEQIQRMAAAIPVNGQSVPVLPLSTVKLHTAAAEIPSLAHKLSKNGQILSILSFWLPIGFAVVGIGLIVLAAIRWRRPAVSSHHAETTTAAPDSAATGALEKN
ncbi:porin PorA family protein [Nocardia vaccinii]|uniref:porin PorA family protein n=1 Tax=Nocardia vaccinii TaxID=1822 RepID=UPI000B3269E2|nr:porin PorA family protein [Nocardia vaccinii]